MATLGFFASVAFLSVLYVLYKDELIGIIGIAFTIGIGFLIYFMQRETDKEVKKAVDRIDEHTEQISGMTKEIKS